MHDHGSLPAKFSFCHFLACSYLRFGSKFEKNIKRALQIIKFNCSHIYSVFQSHCQRSIFDRKLYFCRYDFRGLSSHGSHLKSHCVNGLLSTGSYALQSSHQRFILVWKLQSTFNNPVTLVCSPREGRDENYLDCLNCRAHNKALAHVSRYKWLLSDVNDGTIFILRHHLRTDRCDNIMCLVLKVD